MRKELAELLRTVAREELLPRFEAGVVGQAKADGSLVTEAGRVVGAVIEKEGKPLRIQARQGVVLAAGGFEHNQEMREKYLPRPTNHSWSGGTRDNVGDAINEGLRLGARMRSRCRIVVSWPISLLLSEARLRRHDWMTRSTCTDW